jgi:hypothetical protein
LEISVLVAFVLVAKQYITVEAKGKESPWPGIKDKRKRPASHNPL